MRYTYLRDWRGGLLLRCRSDADGCAARLSRIACGPMFDCPASLACGIAPARARTDLLPDLLPAESLAEPWRARLPGVMRTLVLGGTAWLGSHVVAAAITAGHEVTALARGEAGPAPDGASFVVADRERDDAYDALATTTAGEEREALWTMLKATYPFFVDHEARADRTIPVVALTRL